MINSSSDKEMNQKLDILSTINKVEPSPFLFTRIKAQIEVQKKPYISLRWASTIAALLLALFVFEAFIVFKKDTNELSLLIPTTNNSLYNE